MAMPQWLVDTLQNGAIILIGLTLTRHIIRKK